MSRSPTADRQPDEPAVWAGRASASPWLIAVSAGGGLVLAAFGILGAGPALPLLAAAVVLLVVAYAVGSVRVTVSDRGVTARLGLPWPRRHFALGEIADARAIEVEPLQWGGWGWRVRPGSSALVVRRGEGLLLELRNGRRFVATVEDAATGAGSVRALLAARPADVPSGPATNDPEPPA